MILIIYCVILSAYSRLVPSLLTAFFLGIIRDLWFGEMVGVGSLTYICVVYAVHLYKRKFNAKSAGFLVSASSIAIFIVKSFEAGSVFFSKIQFFWVLGGTFVSVLLFKVLYKLWIKQESERKVPV